MLRLPPESDRKRYLVRVVMLNLGIICIVVGKIQEIKFLMDFGAMAVITSAGLHARSIQIQISKALPTRFKKIPRFYIASSLFLVLGGILGGILSQHPKGELKYQILVAHYSANIFGWIGITVAGTLITFIPTVLRTQLPESAENHGYRSLPWLIISVLTLASSALLNSRGIALIGILTYLSAWLYLLSSHLRFVIQKRTPFSFLSITFAVLWLIIALINLAADFAISHTWELIANRAENLIFILGIGFALQIGLGALSYLIPVVLGGGPTKVRRNADTSERLKIIRLLTLNSGLGLLVVNISRLSFLLGGAFITISLILNLFLLGSLRPANRNHQELG